MSRNKVIRAVPIFVGVLLCMTLMQTAFAVRYSPYLNADTGNPTVWNSPYLNTNTGNPTVWNSPYLNADTGTVWNSHYLNADTGNPMVWNLPNLNADTGNPVVQSTNTDKTETITTTSGSVPPSDLMNIFIPLQIS